MSPRRGPFLQSHLVKLIVLASGLVVGEVYGGGVAPAIAGYVAKHFGIQHIMYLGLIALAAGLVIALCLKETAPSRLRTVRADIRLADQELTRYVSST